MNTLKASYCKLIIFFILPIITHSLAFSGSEKSFELTKDNAVLESRPKSKASVGAVLYTYNDMGEAFVLLGEENPSKTGANTYCELGGSSEADASGVPETLLQGIIRECEEESAQLYKLDAGYVLSNAYTYYNVTPKGREEVYIFILAPVYVSASTLLSSAGAQTEEKYKEKSNFKWVNLTDLNACESARCKVRDIEGKEEIITLRNFFYNTIQSPKVKEVLRAIKEASAKKKAS